MVICSKCLYIFPLFQQSVDCKVTEKRKTGLDVVLKPSGVSAFLPRIHLSHSLATCDLMLEVTDVGSVLKNCVYFSRSNVLVSFILNVEVNGGSITNIHVLNQFNGNQFSAVYFVLKECTF